MSETAIRVEGLGKRYRIGARQERYKTLRDTLTETALRPFRVFRPRNGSDQNGRDTIWALKDVSLEVKRGEVVGVIGRNGAGKSTLLKILSRITEPTEGSAEIDGRVGSLLEVGTGFHPELTGRENILLNGAILGMKRGEIERKFDEIVAFAEIEAFIDTAVKHYSSGMHTRLAFAVAAHLDTDILLVDEVLAVGDAAFQRKCLGKMGDVARQGRTVLFVSHDMTNVAVLCPSAMLLDGGGLRMAGASNTVIQAYLSEFRKTQLAAEWVLEDSADDQSTRITRIRLCKQDGSPSTTFLLSEPLLLFIDYVVMSEARLNPVFIVKNSLGTTVFSTANYVDQVWGQTCYQRGRYRACCEAPGDLLNEGTYTVDALIVQETRYVKAEVRDALEFEVYDDGTTRSDYAGQWVGVVRPRCAWSGKEV